MIWPDIDPIVLRGGGAFLGALCGLVYLPPRSIRGALRRTAVSVFVGTTFWFVPVRFFDGGTPADHMFAGSVIMGFLGWPAPRLLGKWLETRAAGKAKE